MKMIRRILGFLYLVTILVMVAGGFAAWWFYENSTELITNGVLAELNKHIPGWPVEIDRAVLQSDGHLLIRDFKLNDPACDEPIAEVPQILVALEGDLIQDRKNVRPTLVEFIRPVINLKRSESGNWNIQGLPPLKMKSTGKQPPVCKIRQGRLRFHFTGHEPSSLPIRKSDTVEPIGRLNGLAEGEQNHEVRKSNPAANASPTVVIENVDVTITPQKDGQLLLEGRLFYGASTSIGMQGVFDPATKAWKLECGSENFHLGNELIEVALMFAPQVRQKIVKLDVRRPHEPGAMFHPHKNDDGDIQLAGHNKNGDEANRIDQQGHAVPGALPIHPGVDLGTDLDVDFHLTLESSTYSQTPMFDAEFHVKRGQIIHPILPMPLYSIQGQLAYHDNVLKASSVSATNGLMQVTASGEYTPQNPNGEMGRVDMVVTDLLVDDHLKQYMSPGVKMVANEMNFTGIVDLNTNGVFYSGYEPEWTINRCDIRHASMKPRQFPYPLTDVNGTVSQLPNQPQKTLRLEFTGKAGQRKVDMNGVVKNPGPENESIYIVRVTDLPLDETFRTALPDRVKNEFERMNLQGLADARVQIERAAGLHQPHQLSITGRLHKGYAKWKLFPYDLTDISGDVSLKDDIWTFKNFSANHAGAEITGNGVLTPKSNEQFVKASVLAKNANFDRSLYNAMIVPDPGWKTYWPALNPRGIFDAVVNIEMDADQRVKVKIPQLITHNCEFKLNSFPYQWTNVDSQLEYDGKQVHIRRLKARHGQTRLSTKGNLKYLPSYWVLNLEDIELEDVLPNQELRDALPVGLQGTMDALLLKKRFSCYGEMQLAGSYAEVPVVTAAFDIRTSLLQNDMTAGVEVTDVTGDVRLRGEVDRFGWPSITGLLDINSAKVWGYQITNIKGPFSVISHPKANFTEVILGARETFYPAENAEQQTVPASKRVTGKIFAGIVSLDSIVKLTKSFDYRSRLTLSRGNLESWARETGYGQADMRGTMNGWLDLQGKGTDTKNIVGRGQLWISPAAIYELPIFIRIFKAIQFVPPDKTAFRYAFCDFNVENERMNFDQIELIGDAISLVGGGYIRFDEVLALDFVSIVPRNQSPLPFVNTLLNNPVLRKVTEGLIQVQVSGKIGYPIVKTRTGVPILESTLAGIRRALGTQPNMRFGPPPTFNNRISTPATRLRPGVRNGSTVLPDDPTIK